MKFMLLVKATTDTEADTGNAPDEVLLDAAGLQPSAKGWRIRYRGGQRSVVDGPFSETKELVAGYTPMQVFFSRDKMIGTDFEDGLANLEALAEAR